MQLSIERRMLLGFGFVIMLTLVIIGASSYVTARQREWSRWVEHTHQVQTQLQHILALVTESEVGVRGFLLTGNLHYTDPHAEDMASDFL